MTSWQQSGLLSVEIQVIANCFCYQKESQTFSLQIPICSKKSNLGESWAKFWFVKYCFNLTKMSCSTSERQPEVWHLLLWRVRWSSASSRASCATCSCWGRSSGPGSRPPSSRCRPGQCIWSGVVFHYMIEQCTSYMETLLSARVTVFTRAKKKPREASAHALFQGITAIIG